MNIIFLIFAIISNLYATENGTITVEFKNVTQNKGKIYIALYSLPENFDNLEHPYYTAIAEVKQLPMSFELKNIVYGSYAISSYQDINNNGELDKNWFGYPTEPYGFSKIEHQLFPPNFDEASFKHSQKNTKMRVVF